MISFGRGKKGKRGKGPSLSSLGGEGPFPQIALPQKGSIGHQSKRFLGEEKTGEGQGGSSTEKKLPERIETEAAKGGKGIFIEGKKWFVTPKNPVHKKRKKPGGPTSVKMSFETICGGAKKSGGGKGEDRKPSAMEGGRTYP